MKDDVSESSKKGQKTGKIQILVPKKSSLSHRLRTDDVFFLDFVRNLLHIDPHRRPTATEAMKHPWFTKVSYPEGL
jgi:serine/threonine protein kinase